MNILVKSIISVAVIFIAIGGAWFLVNKSIVVPAPPITDYKNATYVIEGQTVTLVNGSAETPATLGSVEKVETRYFGNEAIGDLNGDGVPDVAFILSQDPGGTGTFFYVVAALKTVNGYQGTNAILLGDRIAPQTTEFKNGMIIVNYAERAPGDPMTAQPSVGVSKYFKVEGTTLEIDMSNLIRLTSPLPQTEISSPVTITGEARGTWYFEASFPVVLTDWDGKIIAQGIAQAQSNWMTTDFVPFEATLTFTVDKNAYSNRGSLILKKDNPSGLPQNDDALEIPIMFAGVTASPVACSMIAKLCPDGSYVSRTGPNCEFAPCPDAPQTNSGVEGQVMLGPTCPVMQNPPNPQCADRPYETTIQVIKVGAPQGAPFTSVKTNSEGKYSIALPPSDYVLQPIGGNTLPRCETKEVTVVASKMTEANLSCDTGIR